MSRAVDNRPPLRIGILGAAKIAPSALIQPARSVPAAAVWSIAARDPARAEQFARRHGIPHVRRTYEELIGDPEVEAVYIPLPNSLHCAWSLRALAAGKHVLCEKPLASNAQEAQLMAEAARAHGRLLVEAFHYRYHPLAARIKAIVAGGELGEITSLSAHLCVPLLRPGHIAYRLELSGGATMDVGCYPVNLVRHLAGAEPSVVYARSRLASPHLDRWMEAGLQFPGGVTARVVCSIFSVMLLRASATVRGTRGELTVWNPFHPHRYHRLRVSTPAGRRTEKVPGDTTYTHQLRAFVDMVRHGAPCPTPAEDAVANLRVIEGIYSRAGLPIRGITGASATPQ